MGNNLEPKNEQTEKTAIVIGATGLIGQSLVNQLADADHICRIITLTRNPAGHSSSKVSNHIVDFDRLDEYSSLFMGDMLFSCMGTTRKQAGSISAQRMVDLEYQYNAAKLAAENGIRHYLLVSSSGADAKSSNEYLKMKGELEQKVKNLPFERISIFQPSLLIGQRTDLRIGEKLAGLILSVICKIPGLRQFRPIRGEQVAAKMVRVSSQKNLDPAVQTLEKFVLDEIFIE